MSEDEKPHIEENKTREISMSHIIRAVEKTINLTKEQKEKLEFNLKVQTGMLDDKSKSFMAEKRLLIKEIENAKERLQNIKEICPHVYTEEKSTGYYDGGCDGDLHAYREYRVSCLICDKTWDEKRK
jgi:translation initiation factor 2B subunit (eIF-2B alpha/beta/delta family)